MAGFAAALGGAAGPIQEYGQQMRGILESRRHDFANLIAQTIPQVQDPEFKSYLFGLGGDLANGKPLGPLMQNFQTKFQKHAQNEQALQQQLTPQTTPPPAPPPGPGSGITGGVQPPMVPAQDDNGQGSPLAALMAGGASLQPPSQPNIPPAAQTTATAVPTTSNIQATNTPGGTAIMPQTAGTPPMTALAGASAPTSPAMAPVGSPLNDQYQLGPVEQVAMAQYQKELASPWGVSPRTEAAVAPIFQRNAQLSQLRATAQVDVEKVQALRNQNLALAKQQGIDIEKLPTTAKFMLATEGKLPPPQLLKPGEAYVDSDGKVIAQGAPLVQFAPEASTPFVTQATAGTPGAGILPDLAGTAGSPAPGVTQLAAIPPKLDPAGAHAVSAAAQIAAKYGIPFNKDTNPRRPLDQLPLKYQMEASQLAKTMDEDPDLKQMRLESGAAMIQSRDLMNQMRQIQTQNEAHARGDRSYMASDHELSTLSKPITEAIQRVGRMQDTIAQGNMQSDALIAPELLSVMAGGTGSGLRMNESEIARIVGGRTNLESLKAAANKWSLDPTTARSITPEQQKQIVSLVKTVSDKLNNKMSVINDTYSTLLGSEDPADHRKAVLGARKALLDVDNPPMKPVPGARPPLSSFEGKK